MMPGRHVEICRKKILCMYVCILYALYVQLIGFFDNKNINMIHEMNNITSNIIAL